MGEVGSGTGVSSLGRGRWSGRPSAYGSSMDFVVLRLVNLVTFMVIFVPISQRLLGVRFGLVRLGVGALITLSVSEPLAVALIGEPPWTGSNGAAVAYMALIAVCSMLAGVGVLLLFRTPGPARSVAPGPGPRPGPCGGVWRNPPGPPS